MSGYHIRLDGCFKPYVRMTQRGKFVRPEAQAYLASKDVLQYQLIQEMVDRPMLPESTPLEVVILIAHNHKFHRRDLDNEVKALLDAMQGIVFKNDCWVDNIEATRYQDHAGCRVLLSVGEKGEDDAN